MRRLSFSRAGAGIPLALAAALALTAGACMSPSAKRSSADGAAGQQAAGAETGSGVKSGAKEGEKARGKRTWWERITQSHPEPKEKPWVYGDVRPGKGLLGNDEDGYVLLRKGEGDSPGPSKPQKVRR